MFCWYIKTYFLYLLQGDILDVNTIFKDLATMVHEQGDMIGKFLFAVKIAEP